MIGHDELPAALVAAAGRGDAVAAVRLGTHALDNRLEEDALPIVTRAAERARQDATLHHVLGLLHRATGELRPALAAFDHALAITATPRLVHARARAALEAGLPATDWFNRARTANPSDADVILGQSAALLAAGEVEAADSLLVDILAPNPGWIAGHAALIRLRYAQGERATAFATVDAALGGAPRDPRLHELKVMALHRAGDATGTTAALTTAAAALGEQDATVRSAAAIVAAEYRTPAEALECFARVDPLGSADLAIHWLRTLLRLHRPGEIVVTAERLTPPLRALTWPYLALAWRLIGDPRAAWLDDPRFVTTVDLGMTAAELTMLAEALRPLHVTRAQPIDQSVRGGTQTDGPLLWRIDPPIEALRGQLRRAVADYITALPAADRAHPLLGQIPRHPRFVGSWSVRLTDGGYHHPHVHTQGWLSSALHICLPEGDGGALVIGEPEPLLGLDLAPSHVITPVPGRLILFPSTAWHGTRAFKAGERISVAFDVG